VVLHMFLTYVLYNIGSEADCRHKPPSKGYLPYGIGCCDCWRHHLLIRVSTNVFVLNENMCHRSIRSEQSAASLLPTNVQTTSSPRRLRLSLMRLRASDRSFIVRGGQSLAASCCTTRGSQRCWSGDFSFSLGSSLDVPLIMLCRCLIGRVTLGELRS
jgi:hypothetical protein